MVDWMRNERDNDDIRSPLLPHGSDDDPTDDPAAATTPTHAASDSVVVEEDATAAPAVVDSTSTTNTMPLSSAVADLQLVAAAARAIAQTPARRAPVADAADRRRRRLDDIRCHMRRASRRMNEVSAASDEVSNRLDRIGSRATDEEARVDEDIEEEDEKAASGGAVSKAAVVALVVTAGIATYLATLWDSLSPILQCFLLLTFAWLGAAMLTILAHYVRGKGRGGEEQRLRQVENSFSVYPEFGSLVDPSL